MYLSLIAPCLNEEESVVVLASRFFESLQNERIDAEIVFVDDGSTDQTWQLLQNLEQQYPSKVVTVRHVTNQGIPRSWISGIQHCSGEVVCLIDSDLQNPPEKVVELLRAFQSHDVDLVRAIRVPVNKPPRSRVLMSRILNRFLNVLFRMESLDNKSGFVLGHKETITDVVTHREKYRHFQTFIGISTNAKNYRVVEIETPFENRQFGTSFLSGRSIQTILEVFKDLPAAQREFGVRFRRRK